MRYIVILSTSSFGMTNMIVVHGGLVQKILGLSDNVKVVHHIAWIPQKKSIGCVADSSVRANA